MQTLATRNSSDVHFHNTRRTLDRFTRYCQCATKRLNEIADYDLEEYLRLRKNDTWRGKPIKNVSLNNEIKMLNTCFAKAGPKEARASGRANYGYLEYPPFVSKLTEDEPEPHVVSEQQIERFSQAAALAKTPNVPGCTPAQFWRAALLLAIVTGLRRSSLLRIQRPSDELLREKQELLLPSSLHKTKNYLRIPLGSMEVVELHGDDVAKKRLGHSPNSKTLLTNYKAKRVSDADRQASELLGELVLPHMTDHGLKIFGA